MNRYGRSEEEYYEYCPHCDANLSLQKGYSSDLTYWKCKGCGEMLINPAVSDDSNIVWICDKCGAYLNAQQGFGEDVTEWTCLECGHVNPIDALHVFASDDEYEHYASNPMSGLSDEAVLYLSEFEEIGIIGDRGDTKLLKHQGDGALYVCKTRSVYDCSVYELLMEHPISHVLPELAKKLNGRWNNNFSRVVSALKALKKLSVLPVALEKYGATLSPCLVSGGAKGAWLEFGPATVGGLLDKLNGLRYDISVTFFSKCVPVIEQAMRDKGAMTFFDYLYYLRNMLRKDASGDGKLIQYIYDRHSYYLIDEFQDTNPMQAEVFFYLAATNPVKQWSACVPKPGSLFIVGDPKQSIYRFRSADVTSFLKVKKLFVNTGGDILYLSRNFRSTKQITQYFNTVFTKLLPEETPVQSKFEEIPLPADDKNEFQGIYTYTAYTGNLEEQYPEQTDPIMIGRIIERLVGHEELQVSIEGEAPRPIRYSDIMIITYGKKKISPIMDELYEREIPMRVEGSVPFEDNAELVSADEVYCEVPFCYKDDEEDQTIWNGVMDVVYRKGENWHIIDYKTNAEGTHLDEKYKAQLAAYRKAFKATTGYDAVAHTYHIDI